MSFANNLKSIMITKGVSTLKLSKELGVSRSTVIHWSNGTRHPKAQTIAKLANILGVDEQSFFDETNKNKDIVSIKYLDNMHTSAGGGAINISENIAAMHFDRSFLQSMLGMESFNNIHVIKCVGNSMEPTIKEGEFLFVSPNIEDFSLIMNSGIYVINLYGDIYVKRILKDPKHKTIELISDNKDINQKIQVNQSDKDNFKIIGRVIGHFSITPC